MKYIRTSEKIFEITSETKVKSLNSDEFYYLVSINGFEKIGQFPEKEWDSAMKADTIEELCDEFIVVSDNCEKPIISALPFNELQLYAKGRTKYAICYGAIWTDKGLIYVAKMNDKGELELL